MKKFYEFGDIHFSSINNWNLKVGDNFIDWFEKQDFGNKDDIEIGFAGDIAERDVNPGKVVDQIDRLFTIASKKFSHVYVLVGNHDKKLYHGNEQHSLYFLNNKENVTVVDTVTDITTKNGFNVLFLPHQRFDNTTLTDYYNNLSDEVYQKPYDILFGHWTIKEENGLEFMLNGVDISKFSSVKSYAIGHVHLRTNPNYLGSVWPNSTAEYNTKYPHGYKVLNENRVESFEIFPEFLAYKTVNFGDDIPTDDKNIVVYTVTGCNSLLEAKSKYPNLYIKAIDRPKNTNETTVSTDTVKTVATNYIGDLSKVLDDMIKETELKVSRPAYAMCKKLLEEMNNQEN